MLKFRGKGHRRYGSLNSEDLLDTAAADEFDVSSHVDPSGPVSSAHVVDSAAIATPPKHRRRNTLVRKLVGGGRGNRKSGHKTQRGCRVEFGVALDDVVNKHVVDDAADPSVTGVPYVVASCTQYIEEHGLDHEGLYRLSGQKSLVENLKAEFDKGGKVILNELHGEALEQDINIVAGALKLYLRELPTCVLSDDGNSTLDAALADGSLTPDRAVEVLGSETAPSRRLLQWLLLHLRLVATHSEANKMPAKNLLLLFSPTLRVSAEVLLFLLDNVDRCFGNTPPASPSPTPFGEEASAAAATEAIAKGFGDDTPWCPDAAEPTAEACGSEPTAASPELSSGYESVVDASSEGPVLPVDPPQPAATLPHALPQGPSPPPMPAAVSALSSTRSRALLPQLSVDNFVPVSEAKRVRAEMEMINHELSLHHTAMQQYAARDDTYPSNKMEEMWALQQRLTELKRALKKLTKDAGVEEPSPDDRPELADALTMLWQELCLQHVEWEATNDRLERRIAEERRLRNRLEKELDSLPDTSEGDTAVDHTDVDIEALLVLQTSLRGRNQSVLAERARLTRQICLEADRCRALRVELNQLVLPVQPNFQLNRDWRYRSAESEFPVGLSAA